MTTMTTTHGTHHATTRSLGLNPLTWIARARAARAQRLQLGALDEHLLRDIGIDPKIAKREARRPFWDLPR